MLDGCSGWLTPKHQRLKGGGEGEHRRFLSWLPHGINLQICSSLFHIYFGVWQGKKMTYWHTLTSPPASSGASHTRVSHSKQLSRWSSVAVAHLNSQSNISCSISQAASHLTFLKIKSKHSELVELEEANENWEKNEKNIENLTDRREVTKSYTALKTTHSQFLPSLLLSFCKSHLSYHGNKALLRIQLQLSL